MLGYISNMSNVSLAGSVPVDGSASWMGRWVTLGANSTNVVLNEDTLGAYAARTLNMVIHVTDLLL